MRDVVKRLLGIAIVALIVLVPARSGLAAPPERFVVFGDSLSDPGNAFVLLKKLEVPPFDSLIPDAPYARGFLHFSNGPTWIEQLALLDHALLSAGPALLLPVVFSNYAVGGARARLPGPYDFSAQVELFRREVGGNAPAGALYAIWIGGDDLRDALEALAQDPSGETSAFIVQQALVAIRDNLLTLHGAGARRFLVLNAPDIGKTPAVRLLGPSAQAAARQLSQTFNEGLNTILESLDALSEVKIVRLDVFQILDEVIAAPAAVGLRDVMNPCIKVDVVARAFCNMPNKFLFWDGIHPTVAGHNIVAKRAKAAIGAASPLATTSYREAPSRWAINGYPAAR